MRHWRLFFSVIFCCGLAGAFSMVGCGDEDTDDGGALLVIPDELEGEWESAELSCTECGTGDPEPGSCEAIGDATICAGEMAIDCDGKLVVAEVGDGWMHGRCEETVGSCTLIQDMTFTYTSTHIEVQGKIEFIGENCVMPGEPTCIDVFATADKIGPPPPGEC